MPLTPSLAPVEFFYDRDCGLCQASAQILEKITRARTIAAGPDDDTVPTIVRHTIDHAAIAHSGLQSYVGHRAIGAALRDGGKHSVIRLAGNILLARALEPLWAKTYEYVATHRHTIGAALGITSCRIAA